MSDPAIDAARHAVHGAQKLIERAYIRWLGCAHDHRRALDAAAGLRDAADHMTRTLLEMEMVKPVGGEMHVPPEEAA